MFELAVALRFLKEGKGQTAMIALGISFGIAVLIFLSALIGGLQVNLIEKTVGSSPHITGEMPEALPTALMSGSDKVKIAATVAGNTAKRSTIHNWEQVVSQLDASGLYKAVSVTAQGQALAVQGSRTYPVLLRGVDLARADKIYGVVGKTIHGIPEIGGNRVLIGVSLADQLKLAPGMLMTLVLADGSTQSFSVAGVFDLGVAGINDSWVFMSLPRAQNLFAMAGGISSIELQLPDSFTAQKQAEILSGSFPNLKWTSWQQSNQNLLTALQSQSSSSYMIQGLVLIAVMLGIASVLAVSAIQKSRQIGILKALGAKRRTIARIFLIQGAILGFFGSLLGCVLGTLLLYGFIFGTSAGTGQPLFPIIIQYGMYVNAIAIATVAGTISAALPAIKSARLEAIEVIRNG